MSTRVRKMLAAAGLLFVVTLGGVALSLAHDTLPSKPAYVFVAGVTFSHVLAHPSGASLRTGLDCETCDAPGVSIGVVQTSRSHSLPRSSGGHALIYATAYAPKISLHMLDSVLLI